MLELPSVQQRAFSYSVDLYHKMGQMGFLPENVELLEGVVVEKMSKSPLHSSLLLKFLRKLQAIMGEKFVVRPEQPITCKNSEPEPDLALVAVSPDDYATQHPKTAELVIEIAVSSAEIDRRKTAIYAAAGVREYWIVLPETRQIEVHAKLVHTRYTVQRIYSEGQTAFSEVMPAFQVELADLFPR